MPIFAGSVKLIREYHYPLAVFALICYRKRYMNKYLIPFSIIILTLAIYWQIGNHDFVNFDDPGYIYNNRSVTSGLTVDNIRWAFTTYSMGSWHPLTWLSHQLDIQLYGLTPRGHHASSLLLHCINTVLLFSTLLRLSGRLWQSAFVAAVFAIHPLHVEPVAWVSSRKDLLSAFFFMLLIMSYAWYQQKTGPYRYVLLLCLLVAGLLCKPMLVTVPFILLLLDYWPLKRFKRTPLTQLVAEKVPLVIISIIFSAVTIYTQNRHGVMAGTDVLPLTYRLMNATTAYTGYLSKTFWPTGLTVMYPLPPEIPFFQFTIALSILIVVTIAVWSQRQRFPFLIVGWLWFCGMLVPVIGFTQVGIQTMADRYTYLPLIGLAIMTAWGFDCLIAPLKKRTALLWTAGMIVIAALSWTSWRQVTYWRNSITLLTRATQYASVPLLHNNLALALAENGKFADATLELQRALALNPRYVNAYFNLGLIAEQQGQLNEASHYYKICLQLTPDNPGIAAALQRIGERH